MTTEICPFSCGWSSDDPPTSAESLITDDPTKRLVLHLQVEHSAQSQRDVEAWNDGSWTIIYDD